jgi:hypothetical protein
VDACTGLFWLNRVSLIASATVATMSLSGLIQFDTCETTHCPLISVS